MSETALDDLAPDPETVAYYRKLDRDTTAMNRVVTMGMMPNISEVYDGDGLVIGTAAELTEDDDMYWFCRQINIPRFLC